MKTKWKFNVMALYAVVLTCVLISKPSYAQPELVLNPVITGLNQPIQFVNAGDGTNRDRCKTLQIFKIIFNQ